MHSFCKKKMTNTSLAAQNSNILGESGGLRLVIEPTGGIICLQCTYFPRSSVTHERMQATAKA